MAYSHTNSKGITYYLHKSVASLSGNPPRVIYFFSKSKVNEKGEPADLPEDREVRENPVNGFLVLGKKDKDEKKKK